MQILGQTRIPEQNLASEVNISAPWRQADFWKPIMLGVVSAALAASVGYAYSRYLAGGFAITWLFLALGVYAAVSTLHVFFTRSFGRRLGWLLLDTIALLIFFYRGDLRFVGAAAAFIVILFLWGDLTGKSALANGLEVRFFHVAIPFLKKFTTAMLLALIALYLSQSSQGNLFVSQGSFDSFFTWASAFTANIYPGLTLNASFGQLAESIARIELQTNAGFNALSPADQDALVAETADRITASFSNAMGAPVSPNEPTGNAIYDYIIAKMQSLKDQFKNWFVIVWALIVFFVIRAFGLIFYWLAALLSFIFYQILLASGFVHILGESRTHEVIVY